MKPEIVERKKLLLAGITATGKVVSDIDIHALWSLYESMESMIPHRIDGAWYELHVGHRAGNSIYSVLAGAEVSDIGDLPIAVSLKVVPAGTYAHFSHRMADGGYGDAFANVEAWVKESGRESKDFGLQLYTRDFDPARPDSVLHIYIPLAS